MGIQNHDDLTFEIVSHRLHYSLSADERTKAARDIRQFGAKAVEPLCHTLRAGSLAERAIAAESLGYIGDARAVETLCAVLQDKDLNVRLAAAEALGRIGDERAVQPLLKAMQTCFVGKSARKQLLVGLVVIPLLIIAFFTGLAAIGAAGAFGCLGSFIYHYYNGRRQIGKFCQVIAQALAQIAERAPTPELRAALPDLKAVSADVIQQDEKTRTASRRAAHRIKVLTERLKNLPLPASAPAPDTTTLPRIAESPQPDVETLPRVE